MKKWFNDGKGEVRTLGTVTNTTDLETVTLDVPFRVVKRGGRKEM